MKSQGEVLITVDGERLEAYDGQNLASFLLTKGFYSFPQSQKNSPRSMFCGMGVCFDCLVMVDGQADVRACQTLIRQGMIVETVRQHVD